jgi:CheY-like chemotaxis protein
MGAGKKRVLVVDDSDSTRKLLVAILSQNPKLEVDSSHNATEGLEKARRDNPAVIVLDMMLPEMSGVEFIQKLQQEMKGALPAVVAVTAAPQVAAPDAVIQAADRSIVRAVFRKPFDQQKLAAAVAEYAKV